MSSNEFVSVETLCQHYGRDAQDVNKAIVCGVLSEPIVQTDGSEAWPSWAVAMAEDGLRELWGVDAGTDSVEADGVAIDVDRLDEALTRRRQLRQLQNLTATR